MDKTILGNADYMLWRLLSSTFRRIDYAISKPMMKIGITSDIAGILYLIDFLDNNANPSQIAKIALRTPQTLTSRLRVMYKKGLIIKTVDGNKKNMNRYSLTPKGQKALDKSVNILRYHRIMSTLTEQKRKMLTECLEELRYNAKKLK